MPSLKWVLVHLKVNERLARTNVLAGVGTRTPVTRLLQAGRKSSALGLELRQCASGLEPAGFGLGCHFYWYSGLWFEQERHHQFLDLHLSSCKPWILILYSTQRHI